MPMSSEAISEWAGAGAPQLVAVEIQGNIVRATPAGPSLGQREAQIVGREITEAIEKMGRRLRALVLDLSSVKTMSSLGLGMCIDVRNTAHHLSAGTVVLGLNRDLRDLFRMMKVNRLYTIARNEKEVLRALKRM